MQKLTLLIHVGFKINPVPFLHGWLYGKPVKTNPFRIGIPTWDTKPMSVKMESFPWRSTSHPGLLVPYWRGFLFKGLLWSKL